MANTPSPAPAKARQSLSDAAPLTVAGAALIALQTTMAAIWAVVADANHDFPLSSATEQLVTGAVMAIGVVITMVWARRRMTPTAAPILPESTSVGISNGSGKVEAVVQLPAVSDVATHTAGGTENGAKR